MPTWQVLLVFWVVLWALQSVGVWFQTRNYSKQLLDLQADHKSGFVGTGYGPRRFSKGSIVMIVATPQLKVSRFVTMRGATVWAKFVNMPEYEGLSFDELQAKLSQEPKKSSLKEAAEKAINQIMKVKTDREQPKAGSSELARA